MIQGIVVSLIAVTVLMGALGRTEGASAASGAPGLYPYPDGCYYWWDGSQYTLGLCPQPTGRANVYVPANGQWTYVFSAALFADGSIGIYDAAGNYYYSFTPVRTWYGTNSGYQIVDSAGQAVNAATLFPTGSTVGAVTNWAGLTLTGNPAVDAPILGLAANHLGAVNATPMAPNCDVYWSTTTTCYAR